MSNRVWSSGSPICFIDSWKYLGGHQVYSLPPKAGVFIPFWRNFFFQSFLDKLQWWSIHTSWKQAISLVNCSHSLESPPYFQFGTPSEEFLPIASWSWPEMLQWVRVRFFLTRYISSSLCHVKGCSTDGRSVFTHTQTHPFQRGPKEFPHIQRSHIKHCIFTRWE